jgi:hypothetical protein
MTEDVQWLDMHHQQHSYRSTERSQGNANRP